MPDSEMTNPARSNNLFAVLCSNRHKRFAPAGLTYSEGKNLIDPQGSE